jgi:hypothetical protein
MIPEQIEDAIRAFPWGDYGLDILTDPDTADAWMEDLAERIARLWLHPVPMNAETLSEVLADMSEAVKIHDSFDGSISYEMSDRRENEYDVMFAYRYGNATHGQGFMRMGRGDL